MGRDLGEATIAGGRRDVLMPLTAAVAQMMPRDTLRDSVYQTCQHNGVHFNKQGHANCGLHRGWSNDPTTEPGSEPGTEQPSQIVDGAALHPRRDFFGQKLQQ